MKERKNWRADTQKKQSKIKRGKEKKNEKDSSLRLPIHIPVTPNPSLPIPAASSQIIPRRTQINRDNRILMALQHALYNRIPRVPELHPTILGARNDPLAILRAS